tara:strand:+ start:145 stop:378 length:234 start_codon:yes stop_codon:yes gene_type:complete
MASQVLIGWLCSGIVLLIIFSYVTYEVVQRWRVNIRLASLDESLILDDRVSIETITDAPAGSQFIPQVPAVLIEEDV